METQIQTEIKVGMKIRRGDEIFTIKAKSHDGKEWIVTGCVAGKCTTFGLPEEKILKGIEDHVAGVAANQITGRQSAVYRDWGLNRHTPPRSPAY